MKSRNWRKGVQVSEMDFEWSVRVNNKLVWNFRKK
jgi:hypothetical protein